MRMVYDEHSQDYVCYGDAPVFGVEEVEALPDYSLFRQAYSDGCAVAWNDEIDIAPEALYRDSVPA